MIRNSLKPLFLKAFKTITEHTSLDAITIVRTAYQEAPLLNAVLATISVLSFTVIGTGFHT